MKTKTNTDSTMYLRRQCYDILVSTFNRNSKFCNQDCDELWARLLKQTPAQLRETLNRQRAIGKVTQREINRHCQFDGLI